MAQPSNGYRVIFGPPGTGKTTELVKRVAWHIERNAQVRIVSFTKAGASEIGRRATEQVAGKAHLVDAGTIHSACFRLLGMDRAQVFTPQMLKKFFEAINIPFRGASIEDDAKTEVGDEYLAAYSLSRARLTDLGAGYMAAGSPGTGDEFDYFTKSYGEYKAANGLIDFHDMLDNAYNARLTPTEPVLMVDEAQDLSPAQWRLIDLWSDGRWVHVAGDDDQCQPIGTKVLTQFGYVRIENLNPTLHRLRAYHPRAGVMLKGFRAAKRLYDGSLIEVTAGGHTSRYTPDHTCVARFRNDAAAVDSSRVVYLMRRGMHFRLGETKAFTKNKNGVLFQPKARLRQEKGDGLWVLAHTYSAVESQQLEQLYSLKYGIPTMIFDYSGLRLKNIGNKGLMEFLHSKLDVATGANRLLDDLGLSMQYPLWATRVGGQKTFEVKAMNLVPGLMNLGLATGGHHWTPAWVPFTKGRIGYKGHVYSLAVDDFKTYFADGILTHNCIHTWAGADQNGMAKFGERWAAQAMVLSQSHRIPSTVHDVAESIVSRISERYAKSYRPREAEGIVDRMSSVPVPRDEDTLMLYRDHFHRKVVEDLLIDHGIPYSAMSGYPGYFNMAPTNAVRVFQLIKAEEPVSSQQIDVLLRYADKRFHDDIRARVAAKLPRLWTVVISPHCVKDWRWPRYVDQVDLSAEPKVRISTIHGAKGHEAQDVMVLNSIGKRASEAAAMNPDSELRVFYVGVTRAKEHLTIVDGQTPFSI